MKKLIAAVLLLSCAAAEASVIDMGNITRDTSTGLDWLDVTETLGMSRDDVTAQMADGGTYEGWRYANTSELDQLITDFGYQAVIQNCSFGFTNCDSGMPGQNSLIELMIATLGDTHYEYYETLGYNTRHATPGTGAVMGILGDNILNNVFRPYNVALIADGELVSMDTGELWRDDYDSIELVNGTFDGARTEGYVGSFLVAPSVVPVPAAAWLFISAIVGLTGAKRMSRSKGTA